MAERHEKWLINISRQDRQSTLDANLALIAEYPASSIGHPDPEWKGNRPRGLQDRYFESAVLANLCMWLAQPSSVCFTMAFHALTHVDGGREVNPPMILRSERQGALHCHRNDVDNPFEIRHARRAAALYEKLSTVPRSNVLWAAMRATWAALVSYQPDYRYPLFWQALEALFTSDAKWWKVTERLRDRISYFLAENERDQTKLSAMVDICYETRSKIIHGRWNMETEFDDRIGETERIVRTVLCHIANRPGMIAAFLSPKRDEFLDAWVASKEFAPPPMPV